MQSHGLNLDLILRNNKGETIASFELIPTANDSETDYIYICTYHPDKAENDEQKRIASSTLDNVLNTCLNSHTPIFSFNEIAAAVSRLLPGSGKLPFKKFLRMIQARGGVTVNVHDLITGQQHELSLPPPNDFDGENHP